MKKITVLFCAFGGVILLSRCTTVATFFVSSDIGFHKKTGNAATKKTPAEEIVYARTNFTDEQRASGKKLFENTCAGCHDLPVPAQYTVHELDDILPEMFHKAKLSYDDAGLVKAYLIFNAKGE